MRPLLDILQSADIDTQPHFAAADQKVKEIKRNLVSAASGDMDAATVEQGLRTQGRLRA